MTYEDRLKRWVVVRLSPNLQHIDMARFHKFSDAEGYLQTLRRLQPADRFELMFDPYTDLNTDAQSSDS
ncbi:hypothetical protein IFO70_05270 [Phormidium tenue FACHB-886]|nr:hypothetical protein [Phormidium tenue FACHB-886]